MNKKISLEELYNLYKKNKIPNNQIVKIERVDYLYVIFDKKNNKFNDYNEVSHIINKHIFWDIDRVMNNREEHNNLRDVELFKENTNGKD